jgi:hypothetical protein
MLSEETTPPTPDQAESPWQRLLHQEDGAVLLEYVILLVNVFLWLELTAQPLQDALMQFAADVFEHLHSV